MPTSISPRLPPVMVNTEHTDKLDGFRRDMPPDWWTSVTTSWAAWAKMYESSFSNQEVIANAQAVGAGVTVLSKSGPKSTTLDAFDGPYGGNGPLGERGATGAPSQLISGSDAWNSKRDDVRGPLSQYGIFSHKGPAFVDPTSLSIAAGLRVGEDLAIGGFAGPSSAWGVFGPLSEVGAHGFKRKANGEFVDEDGEPQRTVTAQHDAHFATELWLHERYTEAYAKKLGDAGQQDTSFSVDGTMTSANEIDVYRFTVDRPQVVTVNSLPRQGSLDERENFDVVLFDQTGKPVARTSSSDEASWVQVALAAGSYAVGVVRAKASVSAPAPHSYRLDVTGTQTHNFVFNLKDSTGAPLLRRVVTVPEAPPISHLDLGAVDDLYVTP